MTFLQQTLLWGLPLALLPVLIHLFNRLRHRPMPWAAMMFLRTATRKSTRYAKLRQWLILLLRVLALLALILALSRPLAGGWMGWFASSAPDTILVLLDRSVSMEAREPGQEASRRDQALQVLSDTALATRQLSKVVLVDSVTAEPRALEAGAPLTTSTLTGPSDTAADLPGLFQAGLDWIQRNQPGSVEIWVASDLQASNWKPDDERWGSLVQGLGALPQSLRLRLLALNKPVADNRSVAIRQIQMQRQQEETALLLTLDLARDSQAVSDLPLTIHMDGTDTQVDLKWNSQQVRYRHRIPLNDGEQGGWGYVSLPADSNLADNRAYFVYGAPVVARAAVVAQDDLTGRILRLAAAPQASDTNRTAKLLGPDQLSGVNWLDYSLVAWQGDLPQGPTRVALENYLEAGGRVILFPGGAPGEWLGTGWGEMKEAPAEDVLPMGSWEDQDGPLADSESGLALPVDELDVHRRQAVMGQQHILATYDDGAPFLTRKVHGQGLILTCSTLPRPDWSRLHEGDVLLPMLSRLMEEGSARLNRDRMIHAGDELPVTETGLTGWLPVGEVSGGDPQVQAGVYQSGDRYLAVNRPLEEDDREATPVSRIDALLGSLSLQTFEEKQSGPAALRTELWRWFLVAMLLFLTVEAYLILPEAASSMGIQPLSRKTKATQQLTPTP